MENSWNLVLILSGHPAMWYVRLSCVILYTWYLKDGEHNNDIYFSNVMPISRLLIRVISDLKATCNYLSDLNEILYSDQLEDGNTVVTIIFQNSCAMPLIRLSLRVIKSLVTTYQIYMKFCIVTNWKMAYTKMALIFQIYYATPIIRLLIRVLNTFDF